MEETVKQRIELYLKRTKRTKISFTKTLGLSSGYIETIRNRPSDKVIDSIAKNYPDLNIQWLLRGEGSMLLSNTREEGASPSHLVPILPIGAKAGRLAEYSDPVVLQQCERVSSPVGGVEFAIRVDGDSMMPDYPSGSILFVSRINEEAFIEWGKTYILDTINGAVFKRVMPGDNGDEILCVSANSEYPLFTVKRQYIFGVYRVRACLRLD